MAFPTGPSAARRPTLRLTTLLAAVLALAGVACSEELPTSETCADPLLCGEQSINVQQVELEPVTFDTTLAGFPLRGTEVRLLAARAGDSLDVRAIYRFDSLPSYFRRGVDSIPVTEVIEPVVEVVVYRRSDSYVPQPTTVEAFDVAVAGNDTSTTELAAAFVPERRIGTATLAPRAASDTTTVDTLRIPLDGSTILGKLAGDGRLRVGVRVAPGQDARLSLSPTVARVVYRATTDTAIAALTRAPYSQTPEGQPQLRIDFSSFTIVVAGTTPEQPGVLSVGGLPGRRALLRFAIPAAILDSAQILRATLVLTKQPVPGFLDGDTLRLQPLAVTTSGVVTDLRRRMLLASIAVSPFTGRSVVSSVPTNVKPGTEGTVEIAIPELVGSWRTTGDIGYTPELVLASALEGATPVQARFHGSAADPALRPKLRVSYIRSIDFDIP